MKCKIRYWVVAVALLACGAGVAQGKDYQPLGFDSLAAKVYEPVAPEGEKKVVRKDEDYLKEYVLDSVLALDGKSVEIVGYMLPISTKGEKVDEFLLMPDTGACCYGAMPAFNSFVYARAKKGTNLFDNIPIRVRGKLKVEEVWQSGFFSHLYFLEVDEVLAGFGKSPQEPLIGL
ncbi:DUF3299 domain-containing protein [Pelagicoccus sp. SDUM812005]|uniref:DUF3299 domain-containing protein n=1 Tax=Pelagicoccus sp. SDUM812005 TaxID=3041257 RepID=UPI00280D343A|nr:DUF3299 domain-containing protein [Pelagicoccus sp. SDUM812005]MDQ8179598.1 DUF3299 domain-containing protein [Pelagicoccus sp. SDUM812005]